jgi:hypothetical protein
MTQSESSHDPGSAAHLLLFGLLFGLLLSELRQRPPPPDSPFVQCVLH